MEALFSGLLPGNARWVSDGWATARQGVATERRGLFSHASRHRPDCVLRSWKRESSKTGLQHSRNALLTSVFLADFEVGEEWAMAQG